MVGSTWLVEYLATSPPNLRKIAKSIDTETSSNKLLLALARLHTHRSPPPLYIALQGPRLLTSTAADTASASVPLRFCSQIFLSPVSILHPKVVFAASLAPPRRFSLLQVRGTTHATKNSAMGKQRIVIKVAMTCDKCRSKAMSLVAATCGVDSVSIAGDAKDQVVVVGDGVDSVELTSALRRKVGPAQLVQVADAKKKEEEKKPDSAAAAVTAPEYHLWYCQQQPATVVYECPADGYAYGYQCRPANTCPIM